MKTFLLFFLISFCSFSQNDSIEFRLSFEDTSKQFSFSPQDTTALKIVIKNNSSKTYHLFDLSCREGIRSVGFDVLTSDSTYTIDLQERIVIRNVVMTDELSPGDSLMWRVNIIDSAIIDDAFGKGFVGFPSELNTRAYIRFRYHLEPEDAKAVSINRLNYRKEDYIEYLDGDIESSIYYADDTLQDPEPIAVTPEDPIRRRPQYDETEGALIGTFYSAPIPLVYRE